MRDQVRGAKLHRLQRLDRLQRKVFIVLAAHGQRDAARHQGFQYALEREVGIAREIAAELHAGDAFLAQHTSPQGVVEIDHDSAHGAAEHGEQQARPAPRDHLRKRLAEREPAKMPQSEVDGRRVRSARMRSGIDPQQLRQVAKAPLQYRVRARDELGQLRSIIVTCRPVEHGEPVNYHPTAVGFMKAANPVAIMLDETLELRRRRIEPCLGREVFQPIAEEGYIRAPPPQIRAGVEQRLVQLAVRHFVRLEAAVGKKGGDLSLQ